MIVMKFGGTSVEDVAAIDRSCRIVGESLSRKPFVVVSALGGATNGLLEAGSLAARGEYVGFIDADLATPPQDILPLLAALQEGADVAIGVRNQADGSDMRSRRSLPRRLAGAAFSFLQRTILLPDVADSQCPLKVFRRDSARRLFHLQAIDTWSFDAELLYLARRLGLSVAKVPVHWQAVEGSHLRLNLRSAMEVLNLLRIRFAHRHVTPATLRFEAAGAGPAETSP